MGFGGIGIWQLLIVLVIIILLFGTKKLRSLGGDLGSAIKNFKQSINDGEEQAKNKDENILKHSDESAQAQDKQKDKHTS
ncbi:MAG: twin-arginine translocase TatA/TatE family subunit [Pseudomonadota bacterium]|nr:twin-arginine translocase TatA/TatE family subunit [Pseudomonadota bacterium]MDO7667561.1 twin-arginine translocase TatA/TatE family subunit [Pseudomonadota bacterium]MDO7711013.1 twin-arginine translocase TatA/TatE family subunit [Pseudomonadota bacterium]